MLTLHASCVAWGQTAVLITGAAGSGKSSLALALMAYGCRLIADDGTQLTLEQGRLIAGCPPALRGLIEARGLGLLNATPLDAATVTLYELRKSPVVTILGEFNQLLVTLGLRGNHF